MATEPSDLHTAMTKFAKAYNRRARLVFDAYKNIALGRPLTDEQRELVRNLAYRRRLDAERVKAHEELQRQVDAVRRDLGLPDSDLQIGDKHR